VTILSQLGGVVYPHYRGGFDQLSQLREQAKLGEPLLLVDGLGFVWGQWVITRLEETQFYLQSNGQPLKQIFQLLADGQDVTARLRDHLLSLHITDEAGFRSDTIEVQLDDRDAVIEWPRHGAELDGFLGYKNSKLTHIGRYVVDEIECSGPPFCLTIRGKATNPHASLNSKQTRSWEQITLGDLVGAIAAEHGLIPKVAGSLASITIDHLDQTDESDSHLLTRLANDYGAVVKPVSGYLVFVPRGDAKSVSGQALPTISIVATDLIRYRLTQAEQGKYTAV